MNGAKALIADQSQLTARIIPCLDVNQGRVVKGVNFVDLVDAGDPVETARIYNEQNADEIVFLDITASSDERNIISDVVQRTAEQVFIPITVGGGIRTVEDVRLILKSGADKVSVNTAAILQPDLIPAIADHFGSQCLVVAVDCRYDVKQKFWRVYTHGGRQETDLDVVQWCARCAENGAGEILLTSMDRDGTRDGFDLALLQAVRRACPIPLIASGGVGEPLHMLEGIQQGGADAVLAASIFHYGDYSINQVKTLMRDNGVCVRL